MSEQKDAQAQTTNTSRRGKILVGAVAAAAFVAAGAWLFAKFAAPFDESTANEAVVYEVGFADKAKVLAAHPAFGKLQELEDERRILQKAIDDLLAQPLEVKPPEVNSEPFDDSVWQKNAQNIIGQRAEIERKRKKAVAAYREETDDEFRAKRSAIDGEYLNAILNIRLKLQNADVMRLSAEEVAALNAEMDALQRERGERQIALNAEREAQIAEFAEQAVNAELGDWRTNLLKSKALFESEAAKREAEANERNAKAMEQQMELSRRRQSALKKKRELIIKEGEIARLKKRIDGDIEGRAAKLAIMHRLTFIFAKPVPNLDYLLSFDKTKVGFLADRYTAVIPATALDVTDELTKEMATVEYTDDDGADISSAIADDENEEEVIR